MYHSLPLSEVKMISQIWQIFRRRRFPWMTTKAYSKILRRNILSFLDQCITSLSVIYTVQTPHCINSILSMSGCDWKKENLQGLNSKNDVVLKSNELLTLKHHKIVLIILELWEILKPITTLHT